MTARLASSNKNSDKNSIILKLKLKFGFVGTVIFTVGLGMNQKTVILGVFV